MLKKIIVAGKEKTAIKELLKTTYPTVRAALNGDCSSEISKRIRKIAIDRGGVEVKPPKIRLL